ncbi:hypothetical protein P8X24_07090 [Pyrococcus kukulkanii]|uniref:hypothetical protein n=1 Tax=Pyrococcus kukulkanii TaxID=1609559 RepID=UPI00356527FA
MIEKLKNLRTLHRGFEEKLPLLRDFQALSECYQILNKEIQILSEIGDEAFKLGREFERYVQESLRLIVQMKGLIEDALATFNEGDRLEFSIRKIIQFNRNYDYILTENLNSMITYAEFMEIMDKGGIPSHFMERISRAEKIVKDFTLLIKFLRLLYDRPSDIFKVEFLLRTLNAQGLKWVEVRHLERETGIPRDEIRDILEALTLIGITERMERGGESVYRVRDSGED